MSLFALLWKRRGQLVVVFCLIAIYLLTPSSKIHDVAVYFGPDPAQYPLAEAKSAPYIPYIPNAQTGTEARSKHPMQQLIRESTFDLQQLVNKQSFLLTHAVDEYKRRYKVHPPPNFDKWYDFAKARDTVLLDEYDSVFHALQPFWGVAPKIIRDRASTALESGEPGLVGVMIRNGRVEKINGGPEWFQETLNKMLASFVQWLPDMNLVFNSFDEPKVVIPADDLAYLMLQANRTRTMNTQIMEPVNVWTPSRDLKDMGDLSESRTSLFTAYARQSTWKDARQSCPLDSLSRMVAQGIQDDKKRFAFTELGFLSNTTAFSDVCGSPSLENSFGFFQSPNSFSFVQELYPIFSQSKVSSFQDILFPSPWYHAEKVFYNASNDMSWDNKQSRLFWRGSTNGGYARDGNWKRQHRQHLVTIYNGIGTTKVYDNSTHIGEDVWKPKDAARRDYKEMFDVQFSEINQCEAGDCDAQKAFFELFPKESFDKAYKYKYLLDMDGNAFSGRFYAFLRSKSLVFKMALFREWHMDWIKPWVHYIPLSLSADDHVESVRYFEEEQEGIQLAPKLAEAGRDWAKKVLRNEDLEIYFFRLLLEYGRMIDDNRERLGYKP